MTTPQPHTNRTPESPFKERDGLLQLRDRYPQEHALFTREELARLSFVRWLFQTGRLCA